MLRFEKELGQAPPFEQGLRDVLRIFDGYEKAPANDYFDFVKKDYLRALNRSIGSAYNAFARAVEDDSYHETPSIPRELRKQVMDVFVRLNEKANQKGIRLGSSYFAEFDVTSLGEAIAEALDPASGKHTLYAPFEPWETALRKAGIEPRSEAPPAADKSDMGGQTQEAGQTGKEAVSESPERAAVPEQSAPDRSRPAETAAQHPAEEHLSYHHVLKNKLLETEWSLREEKKKRTAGENWQER